MNELTYMDPWSDTDNKVRWRARVGKAAFDFYIPKWRVPNPWPHHIVVRVSSLTQVGDEVAIPNNPFDPEEIRRPIVAIVDYVREHTKTVRYAPRGNPHYWEIGEPYIPYALLPRVNFNSLKVEVRWA